MGAKLWISQGDGKVDVKGWDKPEVQLVAEFIPGAGQHEARLEVRRVGEGLEIEVKREHYHHFAFFSFGVSHGPLCNLTLMVPRRLNLDARSVDGSISIQDLDGYAGCHTVDGAIVLRNISGEVHVRAVDGAITATNLKARMKGGSVDGSITLDQVEGGLELRTVDGAIHAENLDGWGEGISLRTVDGNIRVKLGQAKGSVEAKAVDGTIRTALPGLERSKANRVTGSIPGRDQKISLHTVDGNIDLE
jgi:DUF4097 and DUF4098 domain-containing protein YvlB